jgi:hypothetical protein
MKTSFFTSIHNLTFLISNFPKQFTMKNLVHFSLVALIVALFVSVPTVPALAQSQKCFTFTNAEAGAASDLHIELTKGSMKIANKDGQGRVGGVFKGFAGVGSSNIDLHNGTVAVGGSVEVCFEYDGTAPDVKRWFWSQGMRNNDPTKPIMLGTAKTPKAGETILSSITPNTNDGTTEITVKPNSGIDVTTVNPYNPYTNGENVIGSVPTTTTNNPVNNNGNNNNNANGNVNCSKIKYTLGPGGAVCSGDKGAAPAGANIMVTDGKGGSTTGVANADGSFFIGCAGLNAAQGQKVTVTINGVCCTVTVTR